MTNTQTVAESSVDELRERYVAARRAFKEAEKRFGELIAGYTDMPAALKTKLRMSNWWGTVPSLSIRRQRDHLGRSP